MVWGSKVGLSGGWDGLIDEEVMMAFDLGQRVVVRLFGIGNGRNEDCVSKYVSTCVRCRIGSDGKCRCKLVIVTCELMWGKAGRPALIVCLACSC